jgi:hypothetical protein
MNALAYYNAGVVAVNSKVLGLVLLRHEHYSCKCVKWLNILRLFKDYFLMSAFSLKKNFCDFFFYF